MSYFVAVSYFALACCGAVCLLCALGRWTEWKVRDRKARTLSSELKAIVEQQEKVQTPETVALFAASWTLAHYREHARGIEARA